MSTSFSPISQLPEELLHSILHHLLDTSKHLTTFLTYLRCCKRFRNAGMPLACKTIQLTEPTNLSIFLHQFPPPYYPLIHSLTISIKLPQRGYKDREATAFYTLLQQNLALALAKMTTLSTFTFGISHSASVKEDCKLPSGVLAAMVRGLPPSCVHLDLDSKGYDLLKPRSVHLCDCLREVLPRLRSLGLRLAHVCPAVFAAAADDRSGLDTTTTTLDDTLDDTFAIEKEREKEREKGRHHHLASLLRPVIAPQLQIVIVDCFITSEKFGGAARTCQAFPGFKVWPNASDSLTACLREFVTRGREGGGGGGGGGGGEGKEKGGESGRREEKEEEEEEEEEEGIFFYPAIEQVLVTCWAPDLDGMIRYQERRDILKDTIEITKYHIKLLLQLGDEYWPPGFR